MFFSDAKQDQFIANLFKFKKDGSYLDIGSCGGIASNNSYALEKMGWSGVCIEIDPIHNQTYLARNCKHINGDALEVDYLEIIESSGLSKEIDYLSLDIDEKSVDVLDKIPLDKIRFKAITIEHDYYLYSDLYRKKQREILIKNGYFLVCGDVFVEQDGFFGRECPFEDWWISPEYFDTGLIERLESKMEYPSQILKKFNT